MSDMFLTFDQWKDKGYRIVKGSKMCGRNDKGIPLFYRGDVYYPFTRRINLNPVDYDFEAGGDFDNGIETFS